MRQFATTAALVGFAGYAWLTARRARQIQDQLMSMDKAAMILASAGRDDPRPNPRLTVVN